VNPDFPAYWMPAFAGMTEIDDLTRPSAELKAALDARLRGFSRNDATDRTALISITVTVHLTASCGQLR
jgi:hypothetical protein